MAPKYTVLDLLRFVLLSLQPFRRIDRTVLIQLAVEVSPIATEVLVYWASVGVGIYGVIHHCRSSAVQVVNKDSSRCLVPSPVLQFETMTVRIALGDARLWLHLSRRRCVLLQYSTVLC
jgi:hypothetical protein